MLPRVLLVVRLARQRRLQLTTPAAAAAFSATSASSATSAFSASSAFSANSAYSATFASFAVLRLEQLGPEQDGDRLRNYATVYVQLGHV